MSVFIGILYDSVCEVPEYVWSYMHRNSGIFLQELLRSEHDEPLQDVLQNVCAGAVPSERAQGDSSRKGGLM